MNTPNCSIVIPCFNDGLFLEEALTSSRLGAGKDTEIIVVDDGSTDPLTLAAIHAAEDSGFHVIRQSNRGLAAARNAGIHAATGKYILPLDADNRLCRGYIDASLEVLESNPAVGVVYSDRYLFGERHGRLKVRDFDLSWLLVANYIDACAIYRKTIWEQCDGYSSGMPVQGYEDWDLWIGAAARGWRFKHLDLVGFEYRLRKTSMRTTMTPHLESVQNYLVHKYSVLYAREFYRFGTWQTPSCEFRRRPFYVAAQLILRAWFPSLMKRLGKMGADKGTQD